MKYRLLAMDMDGTLLDSNKKIRPTTIPALQKAKEKGVIICLSTGRGLAELQDYPKLLELLDYAILISGGCIYDFHQKKSIKSTVLNEDQVKEIKAAVEGRDIFVQVLSETLSVISPDSLDRLESFHMGVYRDMYERVATLKDSMTDYILNPIEPANKINLYHLTPEEREVTYEKLKDSDFSIAYAEETSLEVSPKGIDKGSGLRFLCKLTGVPVEETIAVGDADNDLAILKTAGLAVAMGNANENVMKIADHVTEDNDHDGIAEMVEKFFLKEND